jgi:hypothetical protein
MADKTDEPQVAEEGGPAVEVVAADAEDDAALQARIEQLEAENEELKRAVAATPQTPVAHPGRGRNGGAIAMAITAALLIALAVPAVWLNRMVSDTDVFVATVAPLAQDPDIQNVVAEAASEAIVEKLDATARLQQVLPENLQLLAVPVAEAVNGFIEKQAYALVRSDQFGTAWEQVIRVSHKALVTALTGKDTGALNVQAGVFTLDVGTLADQLKTRLVDAGLGFVANLPTGRLDKTITLYESPALAQMTTAFDLLTRIALWLPLLGLIFAGGAVALAVDRRKAVLWLGGALAIGAILPLQALFLSQTYVTAQLYELAKIPTAAAQSAWTILFRDLVTADRAVIALGLALWAGAIVAGPARWAVAMRGGLSGGLSGVASHMELGRFGAWVRGRKSALRWVGAGFAFVILLLLPAPRTVSSIVWLVFAWVVWILLVELFGAEPLDPALSGAAKVAAEAPSDEPVTPT